MNNGLTPINPNDFLQNITFSSDTSEEKSHVVHSISEELFREQSHSEGQMSGVLDRDSGPKRKRHEESQDLWISDVFNPKENDHDNPNEDLSEGEVRLPWFVFSFYCYIEKFLRYCLK